MCLLQKTYDFTSESDIPTAFDLLNLGRKKSVIAKISTSEAIKHQPYKQILIVYMAGNRYDKCRFKS
jgi:hypothetical protein